MTISVHVSILSGHNIFCRQKMETKREETRGSGPLSYSDSWPTEYVPHTFIFFKLYQTANLVQNSVLRFLLPPFTTRWQKWHSCRQLKPSSLFSLSIMVCFAAPRPLQLLALPSFSSSDFLKAEAGCSWQDSAGQGTIREAWERQLDLLPITLTFTRNHIHTKPA